MIDFSVRAFHEETTLLGYVVSGSDWPAAAFVTAPVSEVR